MFQSSVGFVLLSFGSHPLSDDYYLSVRKVVAAPVFWSSVGIGEKGK